MVTVGALPAQHLKWDSNYKSLYPEKCRKLQIIFGDEMSSHSSYKIPSALMLKGILLFFLL